MDEIAHAVRLPSVLADFALRLKDPDLPQPESLSALPGQTIARRFDVYRNNVAVGLVNALADNFPTVKNLVGEEYFRAMARVFALDNLPRSPLMFSYGEGFLEFIADFEPAKHLFFLADVARLERLWLDSWNETDAGILTGDVLAKVAVQNLAELRFLNHPATRLFSSRFAAVSILARDRSGASLADIDPSTPEDALITRPDCDVQVRYLPPGGFAFLNALMSGQTLGAAAHMAQEAAPDFDLVAAISTFLEAGVFCGLKTRND